MRSLGRWLLTGLMVLGLIGFGVWARGQLNGCETPRAGLPTEAAPPTSLEPKAVLPVVEAPVTPVPAPTVPPALTDLTPVVDKKTEVSPLPAVPTGLPPLASGTPPMPTATPVPAPASPSTLVPAGYTPAPTSPDTPIPPVPASSTPPATLTPVPTTPATPLTCPWTLRVQIIEGKTHLEARTDKEVQFRVVCERLNLQAPDGAIEARGSVKVSAPSLDGTCDQLSISWLTDRVDLSGQVRVTCRKEGQEVEMTGDKLSVKLTATTQAKTSPLPSSPVVPTRLEVPETPRPTTTRKPNFEVDPPRAVDPFDGNPDPPQQ